MFFRRWSTAAAGLVALCLGAVACSGDDDDDTEPPSLTCGDGTHEDDGACVPDEPAVECGDGTHEEDGACVADEVAGLVCGEGTHEDAGSCVLDVGTSTVVQGGTLQPAPEGTPPTGWNTEFSEKVGVTELATYDSSGDDAWDPAEHPLVFITTVGPGYGGQLSDVVFPGIAVIDAETHDVANYTSYDVGWAEYFEPHGLCVSPDGQYVYLATGEGRAAGRFLIVNARTMRLEKILATRGRPHHCKSYVDPDGNQRVLLYGWEQPPFIIDPADDNRVVGSADFTDMSMEGYLYFIDPSRTQLWASGRWRNGNARNEIHGNIVMVMDISDMSNWTLLETPSIEDSTPVWVDFSPDGHWAYVTGGHSSTVTRYDRTAAEGIEVNAVNRAGTEGPYGVRLNWDGTRAYTVGKGEGSHNMGQELGVIDTTLMTERASAINVIATGCVRGDHATLHPDPDVNELWLSCNSSFEVVVVDMGTDEVSARIPMPAGGSTHSGAFVAYEGDFSGEVLSDQNGLHGGAMQEQLARWAEPVE